MQRVYLDQNTLSELRPRKLIETRNEKVRLLKEVLILNKYIVVYSVAHLQEIRKISIDKYRIEHIDLLQELNAHYLNPIDNQPTQSSPKEVWCNFLQNEEDNKIVGITDALDDVDKLSRKLAGLLPEISFSEVQSNIENSILSMLDNTLKAAQKELQSIDYDQLPEEIQAYFSQKAIEFQEIKNQLRSMPLFPEVKNESLGPKEYRELVFKEKNLYGIPNSEIINTIGQELKSLANGNEFKIEKYLSVPKHIQVAGYYEQLNWTGYYADDFVKIKKNKDRFGASRNDGMHAVWGSFCDMLVSNDKRFRNKANACYKHLNIPTKALSIDEFIEITH